MKKCLKIANSSSTMSKMIKKFIGIAISQIKNVINEKKLNFSQSKCKIMKKLFKVQFQNSKKLEN